MADWDHQRAVPFGRLPVPDSRGVFYIRHEPRVVPLRSRRGVVLGLAHALSRALRQSLQRLARYLKHQQLDLPSLRGILNELLEQDILRRSERLDTTNPVAELAHLRKVTLPWGSSRQVEDSQRGQFCPLETPESHRMGLNLHLAVGAHLDTAKSRLDPGATPWGSSSLLIPFLEHNDPNRAMMGAKYLKQALPLLQPEPPRIRSGWESRLFPASTLQLRAEHSGQVVSLDSQTLVIAEASRGHREIPLAPRQLGACAQLQPGQSFPSGQLLAHSWFATPDGQLALGVNALTAVMPWYGYNFEDALVVSHSLSQRLTSLHPEGPEPLRVGDKLASRHGGKGVVAAILADALMPRLDDGQTVELLLNPHSLLSRMNLGQLYELQCQQPGDYPPFRQTRELSLNNRQAVSWPDPTRPETHRAQVILGHLYILKLHHRAETKLSLPGVPKRSSVTGLPLGGRRAGGAQRIGEMEVWALQAHGARRVLEEMLTSKSELLPENRESFRVLREFLKVLGIDSRFDGQQLTLSRADGQRIRSWAETSLQASGLVLERYRCSCGFVCWAGQWKTLGAKSGPRRCSRCQGSDVELGMDWHPDGLMGENIFPGGSANERYRGARIDFPGPVPHPIWPDLRIDCWYVAPPALRPLHPGSPGLNQHYRAILRAVESWRRAPQQSAPPALLRALRSLISSVKIQGKRGLLRGSFLGRRVIHSGRAVIVPDPLLPLGWCRLPRQFQSRPEVVLLQRAPSLHRYNLLAFQVASEPSPGDVIMLPPLHCGAFAADFDGDTMAFHVPQSEEARRECLEVLAASRHHLSAAHGQSLFHIEQDIVAGAFLWGLQPHGLEQQQQLLQTPVVPEKDQLRQALTQALRRQLPLQALQHWTDQCLQHATHTGLSFGLQDLESLALEQLPAQAAQGHSVAVLLQSGARGSLKQLERILQSAHSDQPTASLLQGPPPDQYWRVCHQARQEMLPKKLGTPLGGDLMRKLVYGLYPLVISAGHCGAPPWGQRRSPLSCLELAQERVCQACYGDDPATAKTVDPGTPVGLLAAQSIGERATQDFMKVFQGNRGSAVTNIEKASRFLAWGILPEGQSDDPSQLLDWLVNRVYEGKVLSIHFELVLARMRAPQGGWQGLCRRAQESPSPLSQACFQAAFQRLKEAAETEVAETFERSPANLILGRGDVRTS